MSSVATNTLKREYEDASTRSKQEETMSSCISNILDIPDKILIKIILLLNARERVPLGDTCQKLKNLVFGDKTLLRDLDFSGAGSVTLATDVLQYFDNENTFKHIFRINIENVVCIRTGYMLNNSLGKAVNLVDINMHGLEFEDIWQLGCFLNPLIHVQRLSINWPEMHVNHIPVCLKVLQKPFGRLVYLSVKLRLMDRLKVFIPSLRLCHELRELRMAAADPGNQTRYTDIWGGEMKELKNLETVEYQGPFMIRIKELFITMLEDPDKWTDFQVNIVDTAGFHLAKNVEVCEELLACKWTERLSNPAWNYFNLGWVLFPECLLREVLKSTYEDMPEEFCCLSKFTKSNRCLLKVEDAKSLLKNPRHQISYLYVKHNIEIDCDLHLIASAFSNLTELDLVSSLSRNLETLLTDEDANRRRRRRASQLYEEQCESLNVDSSFQMLVQNTPHLRHFTLKASSGCESSDWDDLCLISNWKSLETLCLESLVMYNGYSLIEIGKRCKNLWRLELLDLRMIYEHRDERDLFEMLLHCKNLRYFHIRGNTFGKAYELFNSLAHNEQLTKIHVETISYPICNDHDFIPSIKQLIHQFPKLTVLTWINKKPNPAEWTEWVLAKKRLENEFSCNPKIQVIFYNE